MAGSHHAWNWMCGPSSWSVPPASQVHRALQCAPRTRSISQWSVLLAMGAHWRAPCSLKAGDADQLTGVQTSGVCQRQSANWHSKLGALASTRESRIFMLGSPCIGKRNAWVLIPNPMIVPPAIHSWDHESDPIVPLSEHLPGGLVSRFSKQMC